MAKAILFAHSSYIFYFWVFEQDGNDALKFLYFFIINWLNVKQSLGLLLNFLDGYNKQVKFGNWDLKLSNIFINFYFYTI